MGEVGVPERQDLLMLIDGTALAYRGHFAFARRPLINSRGENTSAAYAFVQSVLRLLRQYQPRYGAVVFDAGGVTLRHEAYEAYKIQRPPAPEDLKAQLPWIRKIAEALGFKVLEVPRYEADDVIATLAQAAARRGLRVLIVTSDKDLLQLVNDHIQVLDTRPKEDVLYTRETVEEKLGIPPERIPDYLALMGDAVDNIPGVPGVGEKLARELVRKFGSVEHLYAHLDQVPGAKLRNQLRAYREQVMLARSLTTLRTDVPLDLSIEELEMAPLRKEALFPILIRLEFPSVMAELAEYPEDYRICEGEKPPDLTEGAVALGDAHLFLASTPHEIWQVPLRKVVSFLADPWRPKFAFEAKPIYRRALAEGFSLEGVAFDTALADYLLNPGKGKYTLERIALEYLGLKVHEGGRERAVEEVYVTLKLREHLLRELEEKGLMPLFREMELPLTAVLARMEHRGVLVDEGKLRELDQEIQTQLRALEREIYELAGGPFNINSPKQLAQVLFRRLKLKPVKRTKTGYSTDQEVLEKLADEHPLPRKILEYRELFKVRSTYVSNLLALRDPKDGRIHPNFLQTGTVTGRLACQEPNLQNIPVRSELGKKLRQAFVAPPGFVLLSADYSQIELRILAHVSGDETLIQAFQEGRDIHDQTAREIFGVEEVDPNQRRMAKVVNFGIAYGISPYGLSRQLNITPEEAHEIITRYFATYPGVMRWIREILAFAREHGYVTTLLGRRRYIPEIRSPNRNVREFAERTAINTPIQGTAADLIKRAMVAIDREFRERKLRSAMILQVHDELLFEVAEEEREVVAEIVKEKMEGALSLQVPLVVEMGWGPTWLDAHA